MQDHETGTDDSQEAGRTVPDTATTETIEKHIASDTRLETDSLGAVPVPAACYYGAQTRRSLENFPIGTETWL